MLDGATRANVVTFSSGWGDGGYPTFLGRNGVGGVVYVTTDFGVVPTAPLSAPAADAGLRGRGALVPGHLRNCP